MYLYISIVYKATQGVFHRVIHGVDTVTFLITIEVDFKIKIRGHIGWITRWYLW